MGKAIRATEIRSRLLGVLLAILLIPVSALAQNQRTVTGTVIDETEEPLNISSEIVRAGVERADGNGCTAYLAAYMKGDDERHLYYALCDEEFIFKPLNCGKPIIEAHLSDSLIRDPHVIRDRNGVYHLVATVSWSKRPFTVWDSEDLVEWKNERLVDVAPQGATKTWAPEFFYDDQNDTYMVYWTGEIDNNWNSASIYYSTTNDFVNYSEPKILFMDDDGILDANLNKINGKYHLVYRKNGIWVATADKAHGPYSNAYQLSPENVEGPYVFPLNGNKGYGIVWDYFGNSAGFGLLVSPDFKNWTKLTNDKAPYYNEKVTFPEGIRHGSIIGITEQEKQYLLDAFACPTE